jgi:hypothetical protein
LPTSLESRMTCLEGRALDVPGSEYWQIARRVVILTC